MSQNYLSDNSWDWNCSSKNDFDYRVLWGNNGNITILKKKSRFTKQPVFSLES
ncbi:MAG: hypothetical protein FMNOHCHN_00561 [Ignavibacteriaceae bacterium]|nr:hypothetical protein [Ignavibacteriaceae bacterium]